MSDIRELYQELIVDHGRHPRNCKCMDDATVSKEGFNPLCGDKLTLYLKINNEKIMDASFIGSGCAISMASSSLMTEALKGKTIVEAKKIFDAFHNLVTKGDASQENSLGKLAALKGVYEYPSRVKCATLAWQTMKEAIMIITFTNSAKQHIQKMLENKGKNAAFRLWVKETGCSGYMYMPEIVLQKKETDIEIRDVDLLIYIDHDAVPLIKGTKIDYVKKSLGVSQLEFHNPNADSLCGCGESFNLKNPPDSRSESTPFDKGGEKA